MFSGLILVYLFVLVLLYILSKNLWKPLFVVFGMFFQGALGALGIYLFNFLANNFTVDIPLNPFNSLFVGFLGVPGVVALLAARYFIKI
jgi:inhibitor of the pro-sigma K processing machinery